MTNAAAIYHDTGAVVSKAMSVKLVLALISCLSTKTYPNDAFCLTPALPSPLNTQLLDARLTKRGRYTLCRPRL